ncbi:leucine zipper domain-containing protein, partial [Lentzea terrae]|uniref:leucine zipper domain-containing protein n=1 Tax=Lentzea terrae TaxID=2200761 RepID=UPI001300302F
MGHANARLTVHGRLVLVERVSAGRPVAHVAKELGVSRQCAHRWVRRFREEGATGLVDRSSRPHHTPSRTPAEAEERVIAARARLRCGPARISAATGVPVRTVSRVLTRHGVPRLAECDPLTGQRIRATRHTTRRYEHSHAGDLLHLDVK